MQYKTLAVLAFSAGVIAAPEKRQLPSSASYDTLSVLSVLQTGLPSSVLSEALANPSGLYSDVASEFAAGSTPAWFTGLPTDVQTLLVPAAVATDSAYLSSAAANATAYFGTSVRPNATAIIVNNSTAAVPFPTGNSTSGINGTTGGNSTSSRTARLTSSSASSTGSRSASGSGSSGTAGSGSSATSSSSGGASLPTAFYGMGLAGAVGLVGVLAL